MARVLLITQDTVSPAGEEIKMLTGNALWSRSHQRDIIKLLIALFSLIDTFLARMTHEAHGILHILIFVQNTCKIILC